MPKIRTEALRAGLVVATEVKNMDNMLLVPAGCVITEKHISILSAWGISEVEVEAGEGVEEVRDILEQLAPERVKELSEGLAAVFWDPVDKHPVQAEVFKLALRRKAQQLHGGKKATP
jgi:hypothetical protein